MYSVFWNVFTFIDYSDLGTVQKGEGGVNEEPYTILAQKQT